MAIEKRRVFSTAWRVLTNKNGSDEQCRALSRLYALAGEEIAFDIWLRTKPEPHLVEQVIKQRLLQFSPLRSMVPRKAVQVW